MDTSVARSGCRKVEASVGAKYTLTARWKP